MGTCSSNCLRRGNKKAHRYPRARAPPWPPRARRKAPGLRSVRRLVIYYDILYYTILYYTILYYNMLLGGALDSGRSPWVLCASAFGVCAPIRGGSTLGVSVRPGLCGLARAVSSICQVRVRSSGALIREVVEFERSQHTVRVAP